MNVTKEAKAETAGLLKWYVFVENFNGRAIETYNVFNHGSFMKDIARAITKISDKHEFGEKLRSELMYYFWSKCEWEIIISAWPPSDTVREEKVDVFDQIKMNFDRFLDYVWDNRREVVKEAKQRGLIPKSTRIRKVVAE